MCIEFNSCPWENGTFIDKIEWQYLYRLCTFFVVIFLVVYSFAMFACWLDRQCSESLMDMFIWILGFLLGMLTVTVQNYFGEMKDLKKARAISEEIQPNDVEKNDVEKANNPHSVQKNAVQKNNIDPLEEIDNQLTIDLPLTIDLTDHD